MKPFAPRSLIPVCLIILTPLLCFFPKDVVSAARASLALWAQNVAPALLPFMIMVNLLNNTGALSVITGNVAPAALGLLGGYPVGAKVCADMVKRGELSQTEAQRLAAASSLCGPMFIIGAVGVGVFGSANAGYFLLICHWLGVLAVAVFTRKPERAGEEPPLPIPAAYTPQPPPFGKALAASVAAGCESVIKVGGYIVLFGVFSKLTGKFLTFDSIHITAMTNGLLEMTNGIYTFNKAANAPTGGLRLSMTISAFLITFGGFCVVAQCAGFLAEAGVKSSKFALYKFAQGLVAAACAFALFPLWQ